MNTIETLAQRGLEELKQNDLYMLEDTLEMILAAAKFYWVDPDWSELCVMLAEEVHRESCLVTHAEKAEIRRPQSQPPQTQPEQKENNK